MKIVTHEAYIASDSNRTDTFSDETRDQIVLEIINQVRKNGDAALLHYTEKFDQVQLDTITVSDAEMKEARNQVKQNFISALQQAKENILRFHEAQKERSWYMSDENGNVIGQKVTALDKVGVYVPGGKAAYPSTVLMNVIPAKLAGVNSISLVTPPQPDGKINPYVLVAASEAGVDQIFKVGGAQAIAALAYGTSTIERVDKIVGPGNAYVARAKKWVFGDVAIDMIAGPSEICVVADESANPAFVAADLLSQAEHDEQATAICITTSKKQAQAIQSEIEKQITLLSRQAIIQKSLNQNGKIILVNDLNNAFELVNKLAPEHLQLMTEQPSEHVHFVKHAGAIFLGPNSPEPLGDYFAGPNHTLPTNGTAAFSSPLGVYDFVKKSSIIQYTKSSLLQASEAIITLAEVEGLTAHANAIQIRKDADNA
ncbi:histidinol dehydrogenase [Lentibacillus sp. Marseille-P4043]|uniref:histidinol dehydrogenase n=1 Tax=Lentibacillus sp. Marseille-P4043 TaxID=2040293 RepID=UPI000D0BE851|nr:histidinol dehydrogenase [Lentibacillus sp. Marseille-P4043]